MQTWRIHIQRHVSLQKNNIIGSFDLTFHRSQDKVVRRGSYDVVTSIFPNSRYSLRYIEPQYPVI